MRSVIVRLEDDVFEEFDQVCRDRGYAKQGIIARMIRELIHNARSAALTEEIPLPDEVDLLSRPKKENPDELINWDQAKNDI